MAAVDGLAAAVGEGTAAVPVLIATCLLEGAAVVATVVGDQVGVIGSRAGQAPPRAGLSDRGPFVA